jgi:hypothetical protein
MLNFNDGLPAIIQPDHETIKSRDRTQPKKQVVDLRRGFLEGNVNLVYNQVNVYRLKESFQKQVKEALQRKVFVYITNDCDVVRAVLESGLESAFIDDMVDKKNILRTLSGYIPNEEPGSAGLKDLEEDSRLNVYSPDFASYTLVFKGSKSMVFNYERSGLDNWKIVSIEGIDFDRVALGIATYKGELLSDLDRMCRARADSNKIIKKEAEKAPAKRKNTKARKGASPSRHALSPLTRACEIEKNLNKQGFKVPSVSCQ